MASMSITMNMMKASDYLEAISEQVTGWPQEKKNRFADHWKGLERDGAEICASLFVDGTLFVAVSDDFRRAMADFGVVVN